jgi:hypothetical protein
MFPLRYLLQVLWGDITKGTADAMLDATGLLFVFNTLQTEITFPRLLGYFIEGHHTIRTRRDAEPASIALFPIDDNDTVFPLHDSPDRAALKAKGVFTMDAHRWKIIEVEFILDFSGFHRHHPAPFRTGFVGEVMLLPAGNLAGMTAYTAIQNDQHFLVDLFHFSLFIRHSRQTPPPFFYEYGTKFTPFHGACQSWKKASEKIFFQQEMGFILSRP